MNSLPEHYGIPPEIPDNAYGTISLEEHKELLRFMLVGRRIEETAINLYRQGKIVGGVYPGIGHEAITVGSAFSLQPADWIAPLHRDLTAQIVKGQPSKFVLSQYLGRSSSPTRGRDGSVHLANYDYNIIGCISHIGSMLPLIVGATYAGMMRNEPCCAITYLGDGGVSIGDFHEGMNFASVLKSPVIVFIENNQFAYSTPSNHQHTLSTLSDRALGYNVPGITVDGNNILAVLAATRHFLQKAREGHGPAIIECVTMRIHGHSAHDAADYVPPEQLKKWRTYDPIQRYERYLLRKKLLTEDAIKQIHEKVEQEIKDGLLWAESQLEPEGWEADTGVYAADFTKRSNKQWE